MRIGATEKEALIVERRDIGDLMLMIRKAGLSWFTHRRDKSGKFRAPLPIML